MRRSVRTAAVTPASTPEASAASFHAVPLGGTADEVRAVSWKRAMSVSSASLWWKSNLTP